MTRMTAGAFLTTMMTKTSSPTSVQTPARKPFAVHLDGGALAFSVIVTVLAVPSTLSWYLSSRTSEIADMLWTRDPKTLAVGLVGGAAMLVVVYLACAWLFSRVDTTVEATRGHVPISMRESISRYFWKTFAIIACCWLVWLIAHLPGTYDDDTVWQLIIWRFPAAWSDHHPWFDTALFGLFMDLGRSLGWQGWGLIVYGVLQLVITAASFTLTFCYLRRFSVPAPLVVGSLIVVCAIPLYASYASEMVKDSVFSWPWLLFVVAYVEIVRTHGEVFGHRWLVPAMMGCCILGALSRKTGVYIEIVALAVLLVATRSHRMKTALVAIAVVCAWAAWQCVALPAMGVSADNAHDTWSLPFQQVTRTMLLHADDVSDGEYASIDAVLDAAKITDVYDPYQADPVKDSYREDFNEHLAPFLCTWISLGLRHPLTYFEAALDTDVGLYSPAYVFETKNDMSQTWLDDVKIFFVRSIETGLVDEAHATGDARSNDEIMWDFATETTEGMSTLSQVVPLEKAVNVYERVLAKTPLRLFESTAFMGLWVPLLVLCYALRKRARDIRRLAVCLIPSLVLMLTLMVSPTTVPRYYAPAAYVAPLLLALPFVFAGETKALNRDKSLGTA